MRKPGPVKPKARWDVHRLISAAGGDQPLIVAHRDLGFYPLTYSQIGQWKRRRTLPAERLAEVLITLHHRAPGMNVWDYIMQDR